MALHQQKIAAGHNNTGGLVLFTSLNSGGLYMPAPSVVGSYSKGTDVLRGDYSLSFEGAKKCVLTFTYLFPVLLGYLNTTYCSGNNFGLVTLSLNLFTVDDFDNYNGVILVPQQDALKGEWEPDAGWFRKVECPVMDLVAL